MWGRNESPSKEEEAPPPSSSSVTLSRLGDEMQRSRIARLFRSLDLNGDGRIDPDELERGLERMGYAHMNREQIQEFLKKSDKSRTGYLDLDEFTSYLIAHERQLHFHFETLDENKDGKGIKKIGTK